MKKLIKKLIPSVCVGLSLAIAPTLGLSQDGYTDDGNSSATEDSVWGTEEEQQQDEQQQEDQWQQQEDQWQQQEDQWQQQEDQWPQQEEWPSTDTPQEQEELDQDLYDDTIQE